MAINPLGPAEYRVCTVKRLSEYLLEFNIIAIGRHSGSVGDHQMTGFIYAIRPLPGSPFWGAHRPAPIKIGETGNKGQRFKSLRRQYGPFKELFVAEFEYRHCIEENVKIILRHRRFGRTDWYAVTRPVALAAITEAAARAKKTKGRWHPLPLVRRNGVLRSDTVGPLRRKT